MKPAQFNNQEPVAWMDADGNVSDNNDHKCFPIPLFTTPPQRKPLSAEQVSEICAEWTDENGNTGSFGRRQIARAIEAAHGIWPENSDCYGPDWTDRDGEYLK